MDRAPLVFVTVGMDHHPFNRLIRWVDDWLDGGRGEVECLVQFGTSTPPSRCSGRPFLAYEDLLATLEEATVIVCHAGGGTPMMCQWLGKRPILVPRRRELGEHVDDHQIVFARSMAEDGRAFLVEDQRSFQDTLDRILRHEADPSMTRMEAPAHETVARFELLVDELMSKVAPRGPLAWLRHPR